MSLPPSVLDRVMIAQIFNVKYPTQDAELVSPGGANGPVVGYHSNKETKRMLWKASVLFSGEMTLLNQEIATYAGSTDGKVVGDPSSPPHKWTLLPTNVSGEYLILNPLNGAVWTLQDGKDGTPITVKSAIPGWPAEQRWKLVEVAPN